MAKQINFSTSKKEKICRDMLYGHTSVIKSWLIMEVLSNHPNWEEKSHPGVKKITVGKSPDWYHNCFYLHRTDGTKTDISIQKCLRPLNTKQQVAKACRTAVQDTIDEFKKTINYGTDICPISGIVLETYNSHIDHYQPQFNEIVLDWFKLLNLTDEDIDVIATQLLSKSKDNNSITSFIDQSMALDFKKYHDSVAILRCINAEENTKRTKHFLLTKSIKELK